MVESVYVCVCARDVIEDSDSRLCVCVCAGCVLVRCGSPCAVCWSDSARECANDHCRRPRQLHSVIPHMIASVNCIE